MAVVVVVPRGHASRREKEGEGEVGEVVVVVPCGCASCWENEGGKGVVMVKEVVVVVVPPGCTGCYKKEGGGEGGEVLLLLLLLCHAGCCEEGEVEVKVEVVPLVAVPVLCHCTGRCKEEGDVVGMGVLLQEGGLGGVGGYCCFFSHCHCHAAMPAANATLLYIYHVSKMN